MCRGCTPPTTAARRRETPPGGVRTIQGADKNIDPTRTVSLRREFETEYAKRWRKVIAGIKREVVKKNGFGLSTNANFAFATDQESIAAFGAWLSQAIDKALFGGLQSESQDVAVEKFWGSSFAALAYRRGALKSVANIRRAGGGVSDDFVNAAMKRLPHAEALKRLQTRQYQDLQGISNKTAKGVADSLADGLFKGEGARAIAKRLADRVEKIGITRSRLLARTEVISAFNESQLNVYEDAGVQGVELEPEWLTAGDDSVCPECEAASRQSWTIETARGQIPLHPNCRCAWAPMVVNGKGIELS